jgi:hypothetical protein
MDEFKARQDRRRAEAAARILGDEIVKDAFAAVEDRFTRAIQDSKPGETDTREQAYFVLQGMKAFRAVFEGYIRNGKVAGAYLEKEAGNGRRGD